MAGGLGLALTGAAAVANAVGTLAGGRLAETAGINTRNAAEFTARQQEMQAAESRAVSQRAAQEERRKARLALGTLRTRAAAGGSALESPDILDLAGGIAEEGEYSALMEMARGENRARGFEDAAKATRFGGEAAFEEGKARKKASYLSAAGTLIGGAGSMYRQYNKLPEARYA